MRAPKQLTLAAIAAGVTVHGSRLAAQSPLDVVLDGRAAADTTNLTEVGMTNLMIAGGNILLAVAGLLGVFLAAGGLLNIYRGHGDQDDQKVRSGWLMTAIGSCMTVPAIIAAIIPYAMGI